MIEVSGLRYVYGKTGVQAIKGVDFTIQKGEVLGFLGPSGAGKTTTQRILIGLLQGYTGNVRIFGKERRHWGKEYFERIGVAFDFPNLYLKLTAAENLAFIGSYYRNRGCSADELLERVGLLPERDKKVEGFSKGMKMRLNFIRCLLHDPEILFLDEPTSGLDPVNAGIIKNMIRELQQKGKTVFLTTHNMTVAEQLCDRVAFIVDGKIPVIDDPGELKVKHGKKRVRVEYYHEGHCFTEEFCLDTLGRDSRFRELLETREIKTLHSMEATLEEIFIKLTGRDLV